MGIVKRVSMRILGLLPVFACMLSGQEFAAVKLTPGVTTTLKRNPDRLRESIAVAAGGGQTLLIELNLGQPDAGTSGYKIQVSALGDSVLESELGADTSMVW